MDENLEKISIIDLITSTFKRFLFPTLLLIPSQIPLYFYKSAILDNPPQWPVALIAATLFSLAGCLFAETQPRRTIIVRFVVYGLPAACTLLPFLGEASWLSSIGLLSLGLLWFSTASSIGVGDLQQQRFWYFNHTIIISGFVILVGFIAVLGSAVSVVSIIKDIFHVDTSAVSFVLLLLLMHLIAPFCWFMSFPRVEQMDKAGDGRPTFISKLIASLAGYVFAPIILVLGFLLNIYLISTAIRWQINSNQAIKYASSLIIFGNFTWFLLYPRFVESVFFVRLFKVSWFWLTLAPLCLWLIGLLTRIDQHGLTDLRLAALCLWLWATICTFGFLSRLFADIRLFPAAAAVIIAILSFSPWDLRQIADWNQAYRLEQAVKAAGIGTGQLLWTRDLVLKASSAIDYLAARPASAKEIERIAASVGLTIKPSELHPNEIRGLFKMGAVAVKGVDTYVPPRPDRYRTLTAPTTIARPLPETMVLLGDVRLRGMVNPAIGGLKLGLAGTRLSISQQTPSGGQTVEDTIIDLAGWLSQQTQPELTLVEIPFSHANKAYLLLVTKAEIDDHPPNDVPRILELSGQIFRVL